MKTVDLENCEHGVIKESCSKCLTSLEWVTICAALHTKARSATCAGSDRESREWRAHLRLIRVKIIEAGMCTVIPKALHLTAADWEEIYYALDHSCAECVESIQEKIGEDGCNMVKP